MLNAQITYFLITISSVLSTSFSLNANDSDTEISAELDSAPQTVLRRHRRGPAVWGEPAPDYSGVILDGTTRYLFALLFVDQKIGRHYNFNAPVIKEEVLKMVKEANDYFYQINVRIVVVDVLQLDRDDLSLYSFEEFRNSRLSLLPTHDFAALISYRYAGGLAFVSGMCSTKAVLLCGFYPHNPYAMGSIFFHEVAHLIGVPHRNASESLDIPNCFCNDLDANDRSSGAGGCLRIPGYDHDCTLQQMANLLYKNRCLRQHSSERDLAPSMAPMDSLPLCGNGVREGNEECDCGLQRFCHNWNCRAQQCTLIVKTWQLWLGAATGAFALVLVIVWRARRWSTGEPCRTRPPVITSLLRPSASMDCFSFLCLPSCCNPHSHYRSSLRHHPVHPSHLSGWKPQKIDPNSIVVLINANDSDRLIRRSAISRPTGPPPPPPCAKHGSVSDGLVACAAASDLVTENTLKRPPPLPAKPPTVFVRAVVECDHSRDFYEIPNSERIRSSQGVGDRLSKVSDSISRKFDDFDDEFDEEVEEDTCSLPPPHVPNALHYTPVLPRSERTPSSPLNIHSNNEHEISGEMAGGSSTERKSSVEGNHTEGVKRRGSLSSSESSEHRQCTSEDTGSTGLSEEDDRSLSVANALHRFDGKTWLV